MNSIKTCSLLVKRCLARQVRKCCSSRYISVQDSCLPSWHFSSGGQIPCHRVECHDADLSQPTWSISDASISGWSFPDRQLFARSSICTSFRLECGCSRDHSTSGYRCMLLCCFDFIPLKVFSWREQPSMIDSHGFCSSLALVQESATPPCGISLC